MNNKPFSHLAVDVDGNAAQFILDELSATHLEAELRAVAAHFRDGPNTPEHRFQSFIWRPSAITLGEVGRALAGRA